MDVFYISLVVFSLCSSGEKSVLSSAAYKLAFVTKSVYQ